VVNSVARTLVSAASRLISERSRRLPHAYPEEFFLIADHIESNPAKAGLAGHPRDYPHSSAKPDQRLDTIVEAADMNVRATPEKRVALDCQSAAAYQAPPQGPGQFVIQQD
jgi:hypothetical protein